MNKQVRKTLHIAGFLVLCAVLSVVIILRINHRDIIPEVPPTQTVPVSVAPTPAPTPTPQEILYTLSFAGDNTIANSNLSAHFDSIVKGDMEHCYRNVRRFFADDDMSFGNLECILSDSALYSASRCHFKAPTKNADMLVNAGFEYMTTANNHTADYGKTGLDDTLKALDEHGIAHGTNGSYGIYETESGLKIGILCADTAYPRSSDKAAAIVSALRKDGAELVIFALHWGDEGVYRPSANQKKLAHSYIDAGVDIVYGSHPHVLQPVEEYGDGIIMYSMGNFCFGGNSRPADMDSAIVRLTFRRASDGSLERSGLELIPCSVSSTKSYNDYCPTPYLKGTAEYDRTMSKLDGTFTGPDIRPDYSFMHKESPAPSPQQTSEPAATPDPTPENTPAPTPAVTPEQPDAPVESISPEQPPPDEEETVPASPI